MDGTQLAAGSERLRLEGDDRLVALFRLGVGAAFDEMVLRHRPALLAYCQRRVGPNQAEDLVQETFAIACRSLQADDRPISLKPWLYGIAKNLTLKALASTAGTSNGLDDDIRTECDPFDRIEQQNRLRRVIEAITVLPERERRAFVGQEFEGRSCQEIAANLNVSAPIVRKLVHRARTQLRSSAASLLPLPVVFVRGSVRRALDLLPRFGDGAPGTFLVKSASVALFVGMATAGGGAIDVSQGTRPVGPGSGQGEGVATQDSAAVAPTRSRNEPDKVASRRGSFTRGARGDSPGSSILETTPERESEGQKTDDGLGRGFDQTSAASGSLPVLPSLENTADRRPSLHLDIPQLPQVSIREQPGLLPLAEPGVSILPHTPQVGGSGEAGTGL